MCVLLFPGNAQCTVGVPSTQPLVWKVPNTLELLREKLLRIGNLLNTFPTDSTTRNSSVSPLNMYKVHITTAALRRHGIFSLFEGHKKNQQCHKFSWNQMCLTQCTLLLPEVSVCLCMLMIIKNIYLMRLERWLSS